MLIEIMKSKLHCVTVTEANLNYMGSITIDEDLMDAANLIAGEKVQVLDNNNGELSKFFFPCVSILMMKCGFVLSNPIAGLPLLTFKIIIKSLYT